MVFPYHRVVPKTDYMFPSSPSAERFERQLKRIRKFCTPLDLNDAVQRLKSGTLPPRAVSLTFDDGYANNLHIAAPLLKKYEIPATVFIAVDAVERGIMWNDLLIEAVRAASTSISAEPLGLGKIELNGQDRATIAHSLISKALNLETNERLQVAYQIYQKVTRRTPERQMLQPDEVPKLANYGISLGAHTVNHPILRSLSDDVARSEIAGSRDWIDEKCGVEARLFAYPNGKRGGDYDQRDVDLVQSLGFEGAVSADWGCASSRSPIFELPRFKPWEDDDIGFGLRLCKTVAKTYSKAGA